VLRYLDSGSLAALAALLALGLAAAVSLAAAWIALCRDVPLPAAIRSAGRSAMVAGTNGLLMVAIGGWVIGLFGTFHHGPVRVGWVTVTDTLILATTSLVERAKQRRRGDDGGSPGDEVVPEPLPAPSDGLPRQRAEAAPLPRSTTAT